MLEKLLEFRVCHPSFLTWVVGFQDANSFALFVGRLWGLQGLPTITFR